MAGLDPAIRAAGGAPVANVAATGSHVRVVGSFEELIGTPFAGDVNALCWPRALAGDFAALVARLGPEPGITTVTDEDLAALVLDPAGAAARDVLLADLDMLRRHGLAPSLECVAGHPRDCGAGAIATDVCSFHVDTATDALDTYLCTYAGATTEALPNEMAVRHVDVPETRARLLADYGGDDDAGFAAYLADNFFDLHYQPRPGARPFAFGLGHLWRIAIAYPNAPALPCVHRAPLSLPGSATRLLLIA